MYSEYFLSDLNNLLKRTKKYETFALDLFDVSAFIILNT